MRTALLYTMKEQEPSFEKWVGQARKLPDEDLKRHAAVGRICGCGDCFCCAALSVERKRKGVQ